MSGWAKSFVDRPGEPSPLWARATTTAVLLLLVSLVCWGVLFSTARNWDVLWRYLEAFLNGWLMTLELSAFSLVLSTLIGVVAALARRSDLLPVRYASVLYIEGVRCLPFLVLILLLFYGIPEVTRNADRFTFGVVVLSLFAGAYIAEMVRAGIETVGASERESARAIGLTTIQTYRFVIFPQALRHILPPLTGQFASLIKDSSLLSIIGLTEFTHVATQVNNATYSGLESFLPLGIGYLVLTVPITLITRHLRNTMTFEA